MAKATKAAPKKAAPKKAAAHKPAAAAADTKPVHKITLEETVKEKIQSLTQNNLDSKTGREIARKHIYADVEAGHIDTKLIGPHLMKEISDLLGLK